MAPSALPMAYRKYKQPFPRIPALSGAAPSCRLPPVSADNGPNSVRFRCIVSNRTANPRFAGVDPVTARAVTGPRPGEARPKVSYRSSLKQAGRPGRRGPTASPQAGQALASGSPQFGQFSTSTLNTRLRRCAHRIAACCSAGVRSCSCAGLAGPAPCPGAAAGPARPGGR